MISQRWSLRVARYSATSVVVFVICVHLCNLASEEVVACGLVVLPCCVGLWPCCVVSVF